MSAVCSLSNVGATRCAAARLDNRAARRFVHRAGVPSHDFSLASAVCPVRPADFLRVKPELYAEFSRRYRRCDILCSISAELCRISRILSSFSTGIVDKSFTVRAFFIVEAGPAFAELTAESSRVHGESTVRRGCAHGAFTFDDGSGCQAGRSRRCNVIDKHWARLVPA